MPADVWACVVVADAPATTLTIGASSPTAMTITDALAPVDIVLADAPVAALVVSDARCPC